MLDSLVKYSVKNKLVIGLLVSALMGWGIYSMINIPIDAVPDITNNQVQVVTVSPSLAAPEVEQFITYPIEMSMANVQDVKEIRSISRYGLSVVTIVFEEKVPVLDARQLVGQQLQLAREEIPEGYGEPSLMPITTGLGEIYQYTLKVDSAYKDEYSSTELRTIHDWIVKRQLNGIPGIVEISSFGGYLKQYQVAVDPQLLRSFNISLLDVNEALKKNNQNTGGSYIQKGPYAYYIRANGLIQNIEDIQNIVLSNRNNVSILVRDVAEVEIGHPPRFGAMTKDGKGEVVGGITLMLRGANANKVIDDVKERIDDVQKSLPEGITIEPYLDRSDLVGEVINTVSKNLIEGGLIVIFILVLLLGNFRSGLIVASVIPLAMLFAFAMMRLFGVTASVMSLGAIDFGLIVDATVIIVESIIHRLEKFKEKNKLGRQQMDELVINTTLKIKNSAAFGAIIILIVYFPILTLTGIEGKMFKPMALTVSFAIIGALILSFTYVPMVSALFLKKSKSNKKTIADRIMAFLYSTYKPVFNLALRFKPVVISLAIVFFAASLFIFNKLGAEFLPDLDEGDLAMQMTIPPGSSLNESIKSSTKAEKVLLKNFPEVKTVVSKIGTAEVPTDPMAIEDADIMIILKPQDEWVSADNREELVNKMKEELEVIAGASFDFTQPIQLRFNELLTGAKADVVIKIYGENLGTLFNKANEAAKAISTVKGAADIKVEQVEGLPQLVIDYDRQQIAKYGLNIEEINTMVRTALAGETAGVIFEGERKFDLVVRLQDKYRNNLENFNNLFVKSPQGTQIPLSELADIYFKESPMQISRDNTQRRISIGINVRNRDVQSLVNEIQEKLSKGFQLPPGYYIEYGGKFKNLQSAVDRLMLVVPIALILIFILLYFAFKSLRQAFIIFTTIPLSIIGGIIALWIRGLPFSISAGIGFIALFGVAVLDGIVLINHLNDLKAKGIKDITQRLREGTKDRLRPVIITSAVASLGFLPMAIATSTGAEVQRPLATVVIGGIITSTFLTMIILPIVYYYFETMKKTKLNNNAIKSPALFLLLLFIPAIGSGQEKKPVAISLDEAKNKMMQQHPLMKNADIKIRQNQTLKASTFDLGVTDVDYEYGNINSSINDYSLSIMQNFGNPLENVAKKKFYKASVSLAESKRQALATGMKKELMEAYYECVFQQQIKNLFKSYILIYDSVESIAEAKYKHGDISYLSKISLENEKQKLKMKQFSFESKLHSALLYFNELIADSASFYSPKDDTIKPLSLKRKDINVEQSPHYQLQNSNLDKTLQKVKLERSGYFPELRAGYFVQQIDKEGGFTGWQAGISMPIWFLSKQKKVQATKMEAQQAENDLFYTKMQLQNVYKKKLNEYKVFSKQLELFKMSQLKQAKLIKENAYTRFKEGEINYIEYTNAMENALEIWMDYFTLINKMNKTILYLNNFNTYKL